MFGVSHHHRRNGSYAKQQELSNAYAALATELTKKEIRSIGGYSLGRVIGEGTFGKVRLGVHRLTGTRVAIKQVPKSLPSYSPTDPSSPLSLLTREIHHHRRLRHPHVLSLFELIATESSIYLITELCAGGELFDYLVEHGRLSLRETRRIFGQLVLGVAYLHREGVVHRDLKLENVLLDENVNVKIADLGFGREFEKGKWLETRVGTLGYMAPEVVAGSKYLGEQVDVWSLGVILYALVTGSLPFDDDDESIMRQLILDCKYEMPDWLDEDASSLIRSILTRDPLLRPSLKQILAHPFFTRPPPAAPEASSSTGSSPSIAPKNPLLAPPVMVGEPKGSPLAPSVPSTEILSTSPDSMLSMSAVRRGKQRALDTDSSVFSTSVQPRSLPPSLRQTSPPSPFSAIPPHLSAASSPIGGHTTSSTLRRHPSTASIDFGPVAPAPLVPPLMHRTGSAGGVSVKSLSITAGGVVGRERGAGSGSGSGSGSSGLARRKSIGSASDRLIRLDEDDTGEGAKVLVASPSPVVNGQDASVVEEMEAQALSDIDDEPRVDYLSLFLSTSSAPPLLSSASDQTLLKLIADLGFDAGQVAHSVRTSACDSCSAIWWMLKRKREEKARIEGLEGGEGGEGGEGTLVRTNSMRSVRHAERLRDPAAVLLDTQGEEDEGDSSDEELEQNAPLEVLVEETPTPTPPEPARPVEERRSSVSSSSSSRSREASLRPPSPPRTPSRRTSHTPAGPTTPLTPSAAIAAAHRPVTPVSPVSPPSQEEAEARLSYFLSDDPVSAHSTAVPSYFPTVEPPSPLKARGLSSSMPRSASRGQLGAAGTQMEEKGDTRRGRAGSTSMLARATSAIGQGLASLGNVGVPATEEDATPGGTLAGRKGSLPSDDPRLLHQAAPSPQHTAPPLLFVPTPSMSAPSTPSMPTSSITPPLPSTARQAGASIPASVASTPPRVKPNRPLSPTPPASASSQHGSFSTTFSSAHVGRSVPLTGPSSSSGKKGSRGGNLLSTFKLWFGQDPRKRKRASMVPRLGGPASNEYAPMGLGATGVGRSQSMYTTSSPLGRRPTMGSRRSSNNSVANGAGPTGAGVSLSRRSSVSSAHRDYSMTTSGRGMHRRRASDASRTSASERGDPSRPASLRSFSGQQPGKPGSARRTGRHSRAASTSSAGSYATAKDAVYRRPPTTTTVVRRRHGSHGRRSTDGGGTPGRHHRRTASGASSAHRSSSSGGAGASDGEETVEEEDAGEDPIMEEDEEESAPGTAATSSEVLHLAPPRPHRTVSGSGSSSDPRSGHGSPVPSMRSGASRGPPATFTAHRTTHLFGSPLQPHAPSTSSSSSPSSFDRRTASRLLPQPQQSQQPIRNVFAVKSTKEDGGEWVDEDDDLEGYGGGLGQHSFRNDEGASTSGAAGGGTGPLTSPKLADSPVTERVWGGKGGGASRFQGRYAGLGGAGGGAGAGGRGEEGKWGRVAVVMEEEEEE
ncbi:serine/threonine protein kinase [Rhodotorula toruloides]|uniref:Serine/threonine protein kinase n=1 Tax=Rhodotorula toruloides TaxID=5286 RepID=A0A511KL89_RHOTO|nr:serine/threonine protein kinase [Rhodotorula toruloides]